jgi:hypothetical protein
LGRCTGAPRLGSNDQGVCEQIPICVCTQLLGALKKPIWPSKAKQSKANQTNPLEPRSTRFRRRSGARPLLWLGESLTTIVLGIKGQTAPIIILILAWALSAGIGRLGTGRFIASALAAGQ